MERERRSGRRVLRCCRGVTLKRWGINSRKTIWRMDLKMDIDRWELGWSAYVEYVNLGGQAVMG